jgi:tetratricopeptide (TPR) repeat protein
MIPRPQALGAFPLPAGLLLIDASDDPTVDEVRASLVAGSLPSDWPAELDGHRLAHAGDGPAALEAFVGDSAVAVYNRFVLAPDGVDVDALKNDLGPAFAPLVDAVAYAVGLTDTVPDRGDSDGEVAAFVAALRATELLDGGDAPGAIEALHEAAALAEPVSAPLAGLLQGNAGVIAHESHLDAEAAYDDLTKAIGLLDGTDLTVNLAELHLHTGMLAHEEAVESDAPYGEAVAHYQRVLQLVHQDSAPYVWAMAHLNLATAYLTSPMTEASDQLRSGIAVLSLRSALEIFTQDDYPDQWASATVNLANALVYVPSAKQGDNLVEAVEKYEEVLAVRDRDADPLGRARLMANQGNALAHLGIFDHAKSKLYEARMLFEQEMDHDSALMVRGLLDEVSRASVPSTEEELADPNHGPDYSKMGGIQ